MISVENLKRILSAGSGYDRRYNFEQRVLRPAQKEFKERFPLWFDYRFYEKRGMPMLVFKIHLVLSKEEREAAINRARDLCFNMLVSLGAKPSTIDDIFIRLEAEDARPFANKIMWLYSFVRENHKSIKDVNGYIHTAMAQWYADWSQRYRKSPMGSHSPNDFSFSPAPRVSACERFLSLIFRFYLYDADVRATMAYLSDIYMPCTVLFLLHFDE